SPILMEGLRRLENRGSHSAGLAVLRCGTLQRVRRLGKVQLLHVARDQEPLCAPHGIAYTRWATHGVPSEANAHPHVSGADFAVVHNGIVENHDDLRSKLRDEGYEFTSETDTEVVVHRIRHHSRDGRTLLEAVQRTVAELDGAFALVVMSAAEPDCLVTARAGCPVVLGLGIGENFIASDVTALLPVTRRFVYLEEGDVAVVRRK